MAKIIVTYNEVAEMNHILEEKGMNVKIHLHDACGGQSFTIETLGARPLKDGFEEMEKEVTQYFVGKGIPIRFLENHQGFIIKQS